MNNKYSITSNEVKLLKHLNNLSLIQKGHCAPVMLHLAPTNRCNMNCVHCCFGDRDKSLELKLPYLKDVIWQFYLLGISAIEYNGGGDPSLHPHIGHLIDYTSALGLAQGFITNAIDISNVPNWEKLNWVRVSANVFDGNNKKLQQRFIDNVKHIKNRVKTTSCYIVPREIDLANLDTVIEFANENEIHTRIAPDCIQSKTAINRMMNDIRRYISRIPNNKWAFLSDFNVNLGSRKDNACMMHMIKPMLCADGWIYACPSSELSLENGKDLHHRYRICEGNKAYEYYSNNYEIKHYECSYCKYTTQNSILSVLIDETEDNEFA